MRFEKSPAWRDAFSTDKGSQIGAFLCVLVYTDAEGSGGHNN
jgi:hypothetical protein